jgi:signal transduction histidine kinase
MIRKHVTELLGGMLDAAPDAIVLVNKQGLIEYHNSRTGHMFGYRHASLAGQAIELLIPGIAVIGCKRGDRTLEGRHKNGSRFPVEIGSSPLATGEGTMIIHSIRDATGRVRTEEFIRKLNSELEARVHERTAALCKTNEKLHKEIAARHRLQKEILEISEREQQRIGRNLHDDLGQRLVGISYMSHQLAGALQSGGSPEAGQAAKITALLNDALSLTRSLARGLHPVALKSGGLIAALADLADRTSEIYQVTCRFAGPAEEPPLTDTSATHLYRIAREAVTNAVNHGHAKQIDIALEVAAGHTGLRVADSGCGMPRPIPRRKGMGLRIMNYRADVIGASLAFTAPENGGTMVTCTVPAACSAMP